MKLRLPSKQQVIARCTTLQAWELPKEPSALAPEHVWSNKDMDPVAEKDRTWSVFTWMSYWATDIISLGTWQIAGSILKSGLSWREAIPAVAVGSFCTAIPMVLNGSMGAELHLPFSVVVRASFGYYFGYFCIISRCILAMFWLGSVTTNGSVAVTVMIQAIWPSYANIPNHIPSNMGVTTMGMTSYLIFWLIQLPLLLIPPQKLRPLFLVKLIVTPIAAIATMAWCVHQAGGAGPIFSQQATLTGSDKAWAFLTAMSTISGGLSTLACNIPDFSRYAKTSRGQYIQLPYIPFIYILGALVGIIGTSATAVVYGELIWNPLNIYFKWIQTGSSGGRAAAFFCGVGWMISQICTNVTANSVSAANDLTVMLPRYINIRRGCVIAAFVGAWVFVPWRIVATAVNFMTFMGGYAIFLAPIAGIMCADYWIVKRRKIDIPALYDPHGRYRYWNGINWRALIAFLLGFVPNFPGLIYSVAGSTGVNSIHISVGARHLYTFDWLYGFVVGLFAHAVLSLVFPDPDTMVEHTIDGLDVIEFQSAGNPGDEKVDVVVKGDEERQ